MSEEIVRTELLNLLSGKNSHSTFTDAVADFPLEFINNKIDGLEHSSWQIIEHMRIAQLYIVNYSLNNNYKELIFSEGYWPKEQIADGEKLHDTINNFENHLNNFGKIINDPKTDLFAPLDLSKNLRYLDKQSY